MCASAAIGSSSTTSTRRTSPVTRPPPPATGRRTTNVAPGGPLTASGAAQTVDGLGHEREPDPAAPGTPVGLRRPAPPEGVLDRARRQARPGVGDGESGIRAPVVGIRLDTGVDPDPTGSRRGHVADRVEGVVDEVADDGDDVTRRGDVPRASGDPSAMTKSMPRSLASAALPSSSAVRAGSSTEPTMRSVSSWLTSSSSVAKSRARSVRPSSMRLTMVCRRLADSCAWERSASVRPRAESSSPVRASRSVRSRTVATWPSVRPPHSAGPAVEHEDPGRGDVQLVLVHRPVGRAPRRGPDRGRGPPLDGRPRRAAGRAVGPPRR